jgi:hypothetical protein
MHPRARTADKGAPTSTGLSRVAVPERDAPKKSNRITSQELDEIIADLSGTSDSRLEERDSEERHSDFVVQNIPTPQSLPRRNKISTAVRGEFRQDSLIEKRNQQQHTHGSNIPELYHSLLFDDDDESGSTEFSGDIIAIEGRLKSLVRALNDDGDS